MSNVYAYGMVSHSTVYLLRSDFRFPKANTYAEVAEILTSIGGEASNSAIVLSKLGLSTKLDGNWLPARHAAAVREVLSQYGIDVTRLTESDAFGTDEVVIADGETRTVFGNYAAFHDGPRQWNDAHPDDIQQADIVCLDPYFREESRKAAELCVQFNTPYVTLDCRFDDMIARNAAAIVISHELRDQAYAGHDLGEVFLNYQATCKGLVVFTFGADCTWYARPGQRRKTHIPYKIDPLDTTGAGDSFRGAIAYGLLQNWSDEKVLQFASAVAACVCLTRPHALNAPNLAGVLEFMRTHE